MTDRRDDPTAPGSSALGTDISPQRSLTRRRAIEPSPALRSRVLAAVADALAADAPSPAGAVDRTPWTVAAALVAGLAVAPWLMAAARGPLPETPRLVTSLTERALAAGLPADLLPPHSPPAAGRLASAASRVDDVGPTPRPPAPFRVRRLLEGEP
jgi:hypothetical protein